MPDPDYDWVFVNASLIDVRRDQFLGLIGLGGSGGGRVAINASPDGSALFVAETFWTRGNRGVRTDTVTVFDSTTLGVTGEIVIPAKRSLMLPVDGATALTDDGRYLAVFNLTPAQSISITDIESRNFVAEVATPGCSLVFSGGELRYFMICADGDLLEVNLNPDGSERDKHRVEDFFDPEHDPIRPNAVRAGDEWSFVSFDGYVHPIEIAADGLVIGESWSMLTESDRRNNWRVAGEQQLAVHRPTRRLYSLVRQSEQPLDDPAAVGGSQIWVYDLATRRRVQELPAVPEPAEDDENDEERSASSITVTQGDLPLLVAFGSDGISVRDAITGEIVHERLKNAPGGGATGTHLTPRLQ